VVAFELTGMALGPKNNFFGGPWSQKGWTTLWYIRLEHWHRLVKNIGGNQSIGRRGGNYG